MFFLRLEFSANASAAPEHMAAHNSWIDQGFSDGVFQCVGSLKPQSGGGIIAIGESREALEARIKADPFVHHGVVVADITEINVKRTAPALERFKG